MNVTSLLSRKIYWPLCRIYARHLGDRPADSVLRFLCSPQFWMVHRYWPNFVSPSRFSEKVWSRQLHDRDPRLILISDKFRVRDYVAGKVGNAYLVPLIWHGNDPEKIPFDQLPLKYVIKYNHGCGYNIIVEDKTKVNYEKVKRQLKIWMGRNFCQDTYLGIAWAYKDIKPNIIIESFIAENGKTPVDYKFYCFEGRMEVVTVHFDRFVDHKTRSFDKDFHPHEFKYNFKQWSGEFERPRNFKSMVELAELLAKDFNFMRVDLYSVENEIYFGELTPYPGGVAAKFLPARQDDILGKKWK